MPITASDIKLLRSQVMADVPEGGGAATGVEIVDGVSNNVFPDLSELDTVYGAVHLRKSFVGVRTADVDGLYGVNVIITDPPDDPAVSALLFTTGDAFDTRTAAQSRIESYMTRGTEYPGILFGNVVAGMMSFSLLQRTNVAVPTVGTTLLMSAREASASAVLQYVRITSVSAFERTFAVPGAEEREFKRLQVNVEISDPLREDMPGCTAADSYRDSTIDFTAKTRMYETVVADAARYYGCTPLATPVVFDAGAPTYTIEVDDVFEQIVPSAQVETPIADGRMNQQTAAAVPIGAEITQTITLAFSLSQSLYVGGGILPGSLRVQRNGITLVDSGGLLRNGAAEVGQVDYPNGLLTLSTNVFGAAAGAQVITYTPAAAPVVVSRSIAVPVNAQSQRLSYVLTLDPVPALGSMQVSYLSGGRWYVLSDSGSGALLGGSSSVGAGTLNPETGTVSVTLGALPDVGSQVVLAWAPVAAQAVVSTSGLDLSGRVHADVTLAPCKPGGLSLSWPDGGATKTATDNGAGALTGDAVGKVWYGSGRLQFSPNALPDPGTVVSWSLTSVTPQAVAVGALTSGATTWTTTLTGAPIKAGSLRLAVVTSRPVRRHPGEDADRVELMQLLDDGAGNVYVQTISGNVVVGSVNYSSGALTLNKSTAGFVERQGLWERRIPFGGNAADPAYVTFVGQVNRSVSLQILGSAASLNISDGSPAWAWWTTLWGADLLRAQYGGSDAAVQSGTFLLGPLRLAIGSWGGTGNSYGAQISGVRFNIGADLYVSQDFALLRNPSPATGEGEATGTMAGYYCDLAAWPTGAAPLVTNARIGTTPATLAGNLDMLLDAAIFRTAASPVKPGALSVAGKWEDGTAFSVSAGLDGVLNGSGVLGTVDYRSGVCVLRFGTPGAAPSNPLAPPTGVVDLSYLGVSGVSWCKLRSVQADTLRYNATAYTYIPLDADILGLDPVRLPSDGRVPIFRKGSTVVVHHTASVGPATVTVGQTLNAARTRLAHVRLVGANGATIATGYTANLDAGTVLVNDTTGWVQPVTMHHRIEDMRVVSDVQITGTLRLTAPLTHTFPSGSLVSSALLVGNMVARVSSVYDQESWTGAWSDDQIGNAASGTYDHINTPVTVNNLGAVTERFRFTFTSSTAFVCNGEHLGQIGVGTINGVFAPINPASGQPYMTIQPTGWGGGWATGNTLRVNTVGALAPVWSARVVKQGAGTVSGDAFTLGVRADIDAP